MKKRNFTLRIDEKRVVKIEIEGSDDIVDSFVKNVFTDSFGIFYKMKDEFAKLFINGLQVKMDTVFRRMNGRIVSNKEIAEAAKATGI